MRQVSTSRYWTPARDALLARLVLHRLPAERIAIVLGSGATKTAVEVRKSRLGLRNERQGRS